MRDSADYAEHRAAAGVDQADEDASARTWRDRTDQYPVCDLPRRSLYPRSESARVADYSVRQQGDRRAIGEVCGVGDGGEEAKRDRIHEGTGADTCLGQGVGLSVRAISRRRHDSRTRNEIDR